MEWNMDNVNEIDLFERSLDSRRRDVSGSIQDFLEAESRNLPTEVSGADYDLQRAYDATVQNRWKNFLPVLLWMIASFVVVILLGGTIVSIVNRQNSRIPVEVQHFDSLNLRNLLDLVGKTQSQIDEESARKNNLEIERQNILDRAEAERKSALETLNSLNISASEKSGRKSKIEESYKNQISEAEKLDSEISKSEKQIQLLQRQLAEYDTVKVEQARKQQAQLDSEKQLHQIEKKQLTDDYEGKISSLRTELEEIQEADLKRQEEMVNYVIDQYDPTFASDTAARDLISKSAAYSVIYTGFPTVDDSASDKFKETLKKQREYYSDIDTLLSRFRRIPQKNAIPKMAASMQRFANSAGNELAKVAVDEVNGLLSEKSGLEENVRTLTAEKDSVISERDSLAEEKNALADERDEILKSRDELRAENDALNQFKAQADETAGKLNAEIQSLSAEKASLVSERDSLVSERDAWTSGRDEIIASRDKALSDLNTATKEKNDALQEKNRLASENERLSKEKKEIDEKYQLLLIEREITGESQSKPASPSSDSGERETAELEKEIGNLKEKNESLSERNRQYSDLLQALCMKDGSLTHGFVVNVKNSKRVQIYVENSSFKKYAPVATSGELVPVAVVHDGKIVAFGKLAVDGDTAYMIKGGEADQNAVASIISLDGVNSYGSISAGDEIQIKY